MASLELWEILLIIYLENPNSEWEQKGEVFYSVITGAFQRLERLLRVNYIGRSKLEACLLSCSTLNSLVRLLPTSEYDLWVQEMTIAGLDFKNPVGMETFNCFIMVCIIELNRVLKI